jgi:hypothetical protein
VYEVKVTHSNKRKNSIVSLLIDGTLSTNQVEISEHIVQFYKKLYTEQFSWWPLVDGLSFDSIGETEANWLERKFEERDMLEVVKEMNGDKVWGPNSYSMAFFQPYWEVLKGDIMKVFHEFHARGKFEGSLNATFIALFSKILVLLIPKTFS